MPCLGEFDDAFISHKSSNKSDDRCLFRNRNPAANIRACCVGKSTRIESHRALDTVDRTVSKNAYAVVAAQMLRYSNTSDRSAHAEHPRCISNCDAFRILEEYPSESARGHERQSMDVVDPHQHVSEARGEHTQKTAFGCMSMDNIRF